MKILYQNVVPYRGYEVYGAAQLAIAERLGLRDQVAFDWLDEPVEKFPDGSPAEMERIDREMIGRLLAGHGQYDYLVVGCALDSAINLVWKDHRVRAFGAGEILYRSAALQGRQFGVVVPEKSMIPQYEVLLQRYYACDNFVGFASLDLSNPEMVGEPLRVQERLEECIRSLGRHGSLDEVVVGCTLASANLSAHGIHEISGVHIPSLIAAPILYCQMLAESDRA